MVTPKDMNPRGTSATEFDERPLISGAGAAALSIDPASENASAELLSAVRADPRIEQLVLRVLRVDGGPVTGENIAEAIQTTGVGALRGLVIALSSCPVASPGASSAPNCSLQLARACAARFISRHLVIGAPADAFVLGLLGHHGAAQLEEWRFPPVLVRALRVSEVSERTFDPNEGDSIGLAYILRHARQVAEALTAAGSQSRADWRRIADRLEELRAVLELDPTAFGAFFDRIGRGWSDWTILLGLPLPEVASHEEIQRRASGVHSPEEISRALEAGTAPELQGLRILAVDDEPVSLKLLESALRKAGHEVLTATNGSDALRIALEQHPHAVIADWMMPEMDGIELCQALRRSELGRSTFFLLLTGRGDEDRVVEAFDAGVDDYVVKPLNPKVLVARLKGGQRVIELQERVESNRRIVMKQVAEMGLLTRKLRNAAHTDALTDLPNRRHTMMRLESEWEVARSTGRPLSAILIDIDHFKRVNDTWGHDVGDLVLREVANVLRTNARQGEEVARLGGEEFFVICNNTNEAHALVAGERLRTAVEALVIRGRGYEGSVTISVGIAERTADMPTYDALIKCADEAVYAAKAAGRNRSAVFSSLRGSQAPAPTESGPEQE